MSYQAKDGRKFSNAIQGRKYDESIGGLKRDSLADLAKAPGGPAHKSDMNEHGLARKVIIEREGNGRTSLRAIFPDGHKHESVHPETYRAHDMGRELLGIEPPPALQTHSRGRAQPQGPKEDERIRREDNRVDEDEEE